MELLLVSFIAGALTIAAPCILPLLPVIIGGTLATSPGKKNLRPYVITASLVSSIVIFTLLLRFSTSLLGVPQTFWQFVSGGILILLGIMFIRPDLWERLPGMSSLSIASNKTLGKGYKQQGLGGDILMGAALGPIFNSCSPTYLFIVAAILPISFAQGLIYLAAYAAGLAVALLAVSLGGQKVVHKLGWLTDPNAGYKKVIGLIFILVGLAVLFGFDKTAQTFILEQGWYNPLAGFEESLRN